ncbi:undecaprenyl-diphosphate phosphatase [Pseudoflavonifractor sp. SW1122]|uniref:undecaprenyl-diphosphate phosphatase n=1 Tax=unclassified Pseudoflavonifractor TaxID=2628103 RepID=UPI000B37DC28|nr:MULTISPECIES: undecaprenyl-diphosphate phosphatase [unclassified Pseudoflavonifractor]NJE73384.1 undecaprenyl-diphosphate phosphatase [Pseudoflavonifractor sp. SW1122]OUN99606.1 undecaprenyl-diphosphatase [Pseudoflavonifractor sp. An44]OUP65659.1 undecaprenyl-diphosphatase [Pseudoflavonifractor sp. An176]
MLVLELLKSLFLGVVEGITEWLPISSTGHLILVDEFIKLNVTTEFMDMYRYVIQLGAILAVLLLFFHRLNPFSPRKSVRQKRDTWNLWGKVVLACIPSAVVGLPLNDWMDEHLMTPWVVAAALIIYGLGFLYVENLHRTPSVRSTGDITWKTALLIGLFQTLSIIPGTSRSGATILGAILIGCARPAAAEFSFFLAIPTMVGVSILKLGKFFAEKLMAGEPVFTGEEAAILAVGFVVSFVVSVVCIRFLMNFVKKHDFKIFGWYRIVLGALVLLFFGVQALLAH